MKKRIIVSLAVDNPGRQRYQNALKKLRTSVMSHFIGHMKFYSGEYPEGCPTHQEVNYGFKPFVINKCREEGFDQVLWIDAGCIIKQKLDPIWNIIDSQGYYLQLNGWTTGDWSSDRCLELMGVSREEAFKMPHAMANVMGFDFTNPTCCKLFDTWNNWSKVEGVFSGNWKEHRHDQTVISIVASQMGLNFTDTSKEKLLTYGKPDKEGYVIVAAGA